MSQPDYGCTREEFWEWIETCPATHSLLSDNNGNASFSFWFEEPSIEDEENEHG